MLLVILGLGYVVLNVIIGENDAHWYESVWSVDMFSVIVVVVIRWTRVRMSSSLCG